jgi:hypothetical protein
MQIVDEMMRVGTGIDLPPLIHTVHMFTTDLGEEPTRR